MSHRRARAMLATILLSLGGCRLFRAEVGIGLGIGADVHLSGLVRTGALATKVPRYFDVLKLLPTE